MSTAVATKPFDLSLHNGILTIQSAATNEHRTFRIRRRKDNSKFAPGQRTVGLLVGADNQNDYQDFGFVTDDGRIILWKKHRDSAFYVWVAKCLSNPERYVDKVRFNFEARCRRCSRPLSDPLSCSVGLGPECRQKEGI